MHDLLSSIGQVITGAFIAVMASFGFVPTPPPVVQEPTFGVALPSAVAVFETSLASPITSSANSMTLTANSVRGGSTLSGYNCFTVDEGRTDAEFICGTISGTAVSSLERGIDPFTGTSTNATLQFAHRRGAVVKITDFPHVQRMRNILNGGETVPNLMSYDTDVLIEIGSPTTTIATKYYVDNVAVAGASNADTSTKGIVEIATAEEAKRSTALGSTGAVLGLPASLATTTCNSQTASGTIPVTDSGGFVSKCFTNYADPAGFTIGTLTATGTLTIGSSSTRATTTNYGPMIGGNIVIQAVSSTTLTGATTPQPVFIATSTNSLVLSSTNATTTDFIGFALQNATNGSTSTVQVEGIVPGFSGLTRGSEYYVTATGTIGTARVAGSLFVGYALSTTEILINKGSNAQWQYLGSVSFLTSSAGVTSCVANATSTTMATKYIAKVSALNSTSQWGSSDTFVFTKNGAEAPSSSFTVTDSGPTVSSPSLAITQSGSVVTLTAGYVNGGGNGTCSGTLYMYR